MGWYVELVMVVGCSTHVLERDATLQAWMRRFWDAVSSINFIASTKIIELKPILLNTDKLGAWYKYLDKNDYGIK